MRKACKKLLLLMLYLLLAGCGVLTLLARETEDAQVARARGALGLEGISLYDFNTVSTSDGLMAFCMPQYFSREDPRDL